MHYFRALRKGTDHENRLNTIFIDSNCQRPRLLKPVKTLRLKRKLFKAVVF